MRRIVLALAAAAAAAGGGPEDEYEDPPPAGEALGVLISPLPPSAATTAGLAVADGVLIRRVVPGSPAAEAGLRPGDIVLAVDGQRVEGPQAFRHIIEAQNDASIGLRVARGGERLELTSALAAYAELALQREPIADDARWRRSLQAPEAVGDAGCSSDIVALPAGRSAAAQAMTRPGPAGAAPTDAAAADAEPLAGPPATSPPPPTTPGWRLIIDLSTSEAP
jgi:membrane-associated protease RseP (regulator of RpoE activity)